MTLQDKYDLVFLNEIRGISLEGHMELTANTEKTMVELLDKVKPKRMLEIGFNAGHSAFMWQTLGTTLEYFHAVDICQHQYTKPCSQIMQTVFPEFKFGEMDSKKLGESNSLVEYDTVFIDGDHTTEGFTSDLRACMMGQVDNIIVDDWDLSRGVRHTLQDAVNDVNNPYQITGFYKYDNDNIVRGGRTKSVIALVQRIIPDDTV